MTRIDKLINRFLDNPRSLHFMKIEKLLLHLGFHRTKIKGSHYQYDHLSTRRSISIPIHNNDCKDIYKTEIAKLFKLILNKN